MAQPGSATVLGTVGREFESRRPDHTYKGIIDLVGSMVSKGVREKGCTTSSLF